VKLSASSASKSWGFKMVRLGKDHLSQLGQDLVSLLDELPETISLEDVQRHPWLHRLFLACDDLSNRAEYRALEWCKTKGYPE